MNNLLKNGAQSLSSFFLPQKKVSSYRACLNLNLDKISMSYGKELPKRFELSGCDSVSCNPADLSDVLTQWVKKHSLQDALCTWVLQPEHYQLLLIDSLPVPEEELRQAVFWKIKPMINFPIEQAVFDYFLLPETKSAASTKVMTIVVAQAEYLSSTSELIQKSGLNLDAIIIPELALNTMASYLKDQEKSLFLIYVEENITHFIISLNKTLYLMRRLEFNFNSMNEAEVTAATDQFALEIQRSMDYFQSQYRLPAPAKGIVATSYSSAKALVDLLLQRLAIPIEVLDVTSKKLYGGETLPVDKQGQYLPVLGGLLKGKEFIYAPTD